MIEQGLCDLINSSSAVRQILGPSGGGYMDETPKGWDEVTPTWTWTQVSRLPQYGLQFQPGLTRMMWQIDCYGLGATNSQLDAPQGADCVALAYAIYSALSGTGGGVTLADPQKTKLDSVFNTDWKTWFDGAGRTYRVMLEFRIWFYQTG